MNFDDIFIFFQRNPWILRIGNKFFDNFDKILPFIESLKFWDLSHDFLAVFRKISKKKQGRPFESSNFRLNPLALSTHAHVACLCACLHMHACTHVHRVVRARVSRVWEPGRRWIFGKSPKFTILEEIFQNFSKNKHFYFLSRPKAKPEGLKWAAERSGERAAKNMHAPCAHMCEKLRCGECATKNAPEA